MLNTFSIFSNFVDGGSHRRSNLHVNKLVLYPFIENVALISDTSNSFSQISKDVAHVLMMFLNSGEGATSFLVLEDSSSLVVEF